jgi:hypothetical protein
MALKSNAEEPALIAQEVGAVGYVGCKEGWDGRQ